MSDKITETLRAYIDHVRENYEHYKPILMKDADELSLFWIDPYNNDRGISSEEFDRILSLSEPYRTAINSTFSGLISPSGVYTGPIKKSIKVNDDLISMTVGPGEQDSFGWLTGRIRLYYQLDSKNMYDTIHFG